MPAKPCRPYYENAAEFRGDGSTPCRRSSLAERLGRNGRDYFATHYSWPVIEQKYLDMLNSFAFIRPFDERFRVGSRGGLETFRRRRTH